ncbi:MAG: hypothetical protein U0166_08760 [Acidobacteriota bacterium]
MAIKKIFGGKVPEKKELTAHEEAILDGVSEHIAKQQAGGPKKRDSKGVARDGAKPAAKAKAVAATPAAGGADPWSEIEGEISRRIEEKGSRKGLSVGTRIAEKAKADKVKAEKARTVMPPKTDKSRVEKIEKAPKTEEREAIARADVKNLREISEQLEEKIVESGVHVMESVERNVYKVLGMDVDEADLPRDAEELLARSVKLMRAAKGFTEGKKFREAVFCYEKANVLFDKILELDERRTTTRDMKKLVERFVAILKKRL